MKKTIKSTILFLTIIVPILLANAGIAHAVEDPLDALKEIGNKSGLPGYSAGSKTPAHGESSVQEGAQEITSAIYFAVDFIKYALASIAVLMLVVNGVRLVIGGEEEEMSKQKRSVMYAIGGLIIVILADVMVKRVFFGEYGEAFTSEADAKLFAEEGAAQFKGIYTFVEIFVAAIAVGSIIYAGVRILTSGGEEDVITKHKTHIFYALGGLMLIGIAELVVKGIIFPEQGESIPDAEKAKVLIVGITNFISGFIALVAVIMYIYGGYLYVVSGVDDDGMNKAKKTLINATIGILIAAAAFAIVNTVVDFDSTANQADEHQITGGY